MADNNGDDPDEEDYEVGYGRPPKHSRFPKGVSGNPKGPKKGSRALKTDLDEALRATLTINVNGKKKRGTTQALSMYALAIRAATGDLRANKQLVDVVLAVFGPGDRGGAEAKLSKQDEELLERLLDRLDLDVAGDDEDAAPAADNADQQEGGDDV